MTTHAVHSDRMVERYAMKYGIGVHKDKYDCYYRVVRFATICMELLYFVRIIVEDDYCIIYKRRGKIEVRKYICCMELAMLIERIIKAKTKAWKISLLNQFFKREEEWISLDFMSNFTSNY